MPYDHSTVEPKWQARWREAGLHKTPTDANKQGWPTLTIDASMQVAER